jgi:hypothetical protein
LAGSLAYVDTSAYLKLLFTEHETQIGGAAGLGSETRALTSIPQ